MKTISIDELNTRIAGELRERNLLVPRSLLYSEWEEVPINEGTIGAIEKVIRDLLTL